MPKPTEPLTHTIDLLVDTSLPEAERNNLLRAYEAGRRQALLDGASAEDDAAPDPLATLREAPGAGPVGRRAGSPRRADAQLRLGQRHAREGTAMTPEAMEQAEHARGLAEGIRLERERCTAILESPEAEGRWQAAKVFALATNMEPEAARTALARLPQDPAPEAALGAALFARSRP